MPTDQDRMDIEPGPPPFPPRFPAGVVAIGQAVTESTNDDAVALAATTDSPFTIVWADQQLRGRGRRGRAWASPSGNIYCTTLADATGDPPYSPCIVFVAALAVHATVRAFIPADRDVRIKWPNDVLIEGRKVSGILIEMTTGRKGPMYAVGIGLNVAHHPPVEALYPVTSLRAEGSAAQRNDVLTLLAANLLGFLELWRDAGFDALRNRYLSVAHRFGQTISVNLGTETITGIYRDVTDRGLVLEMPDGSRRTLGAGDIIRGAG